VAYAHKIEKAEAAIDWRRPAAELDRQVRAFDPFPGASTSAGGELLKIWAAQPEAGSAGQLPGTVLSTGADGIRVATGDGVLRLTELQRPGGRRLPAAEVLRGFPLSVGQALGAVPAA
jgi:methionyl-tRNA formyltransferase